MNTVTNQYLVDYTVRNITTGDEEDIRVLELDDDEIEGFPEAVRDEIRALIVRSAERYRGGNTLDTRVDWGTDSERIRELLLPYISDQALYEADYVLWEQRVLGEEVSDWHAGYAVGWHDAMRGAASPANAGAVDTTTDTREAGYHAGFRDYCLETGLLEDETLHACDTCARRLARRGEDLCDHCGHFGEGAEGLEDALDSLERLARP